MSVSSFLQMPKEGTCSIGLCTRDMIQAWRLCMGQHHGLFITHCAWLLPPSAQADNSRSQGWLLLWHHWVGNGDNPAMSYTEPFHKEGPKLSSWNRYLFWRVICLLCLQYFYEHPPWTYSPPWYPTQIASDPATHFTAKSKNKTKKKNIAMGLCQWNSLVLP